MKPRKALSLVLCMVAFAAHAASVSIDTIKFAAGSWARSNAALGVRHGRAVSAVEPYEVGGTNGFYAVSLEGGGTVFMSADDEITPVIAFTSASNPDLSACGCISANENSLLHLIRHSVPPSPQGEGLVRATRLYISSTRQSAKYFLSS